MYYFETDNKKYVRMLHFLKKKKKKKKKCLWNYKKVRKIPKGPQDRNPTRPTKQRSIIRIAIKCYAISPLNPTKLSKSLRVRIWALGYVSLMGGSYVGQALFIVGIF